MNGLSAMGKLVEQIGKGASKVEIFFYLLNQHLDLVNKYYAIMLESSKHNFRNNKPAVILREKNVIVKKYRRGTKMAV